MNELTSAAQITEALSLSSAHLGCNEVIKGVEGYAAILTDEGRKKLAQAVDDGKSDRIALLEDTLQFIIAHGHDRPISRIKTVCEMSLQGIDYRKPLRDLKWVGRALGNQPLATSPPPNSPRA